MQAKFSFYSLNIIRKKMKNSYLFHANIQVIGFFNTVWISLINSLNLFHLTMRLSRRHYRCRLLSTIVKNAYTSILYRT